MDKCHHDKTAGSWVWVQTKVDGDFLMKEAWQIDKEILHVEYFLNFILILYIVSFEHKKSIFYILYFKYKKSYKPIFRILDTCQWLIKGHVVRIIDLF